MFFTKEEAKKILEYSSLDCFASSSINYNNAACQALSEAICEGDDYYNAALGFVLGVAAGKRIERNREREKKTMGNLTDTDIMIALGLFESYLQPGETFDIPEEFDSPEAQAFVAGMIARKRYVLEGVKKDVR